MKVGFIGLGLMGSSMALAIKKYCRKIDIYGYDQNTDNLSYTIENGYIDLQLKEEDFAALDILFIAVPVNKIINVIKKIYPYLDLTRTLVTDMGSTKSYISKTIMERFPELCFLGGHPMTGREVSGPEYADADLFTNMTYIITSDTCTNDEDNLIQQNNILSLQESFKKKEEKLINILNQIGARILYMESEMHDKIVALTSHLPHFLASSLVGRIIDAEKHYPDIDKIMGQGFRDFTRIAACSPQIWKDIFISNRDHILNQVDSMIEQMIYLREVIEREKEDEIYNFLKTTQEKRLRLNENFEKVSKDEL
ncbi:MAG: prephenate dehydrogenase [Halanaerobiales bacterium]